MNKTLETKFKNITITNNFLEKDFLNFIQDYFSIKINSGQYDKNLNTFLYGYKFYSDHLVETILQNSCEYISEIIGVQVAPTYSLTNMYMCGDEFKDEINDSSEISALLCLGISEELNSISIFNKDEKFNIKSGDLLIYNSRNTKLKINCLTNKWILLSKLNFVDIEGPYKDNIYDKRPYLGFNQYSENFNGEN